MFNSRLSSNDVKELIESKSDSARINTAEKIYLSYSANELTHEERALAEEVFRLLVSDESVNVRASIANNLKDCDQIPNEIAKKLATDLEDAVALPVLRCSQVLTDKDLIDIIRSNACERQSAIAERPLVSGSVSDELIEHGDENVVVSLIKNNGADIPKGSMERAYGRFAGEDTFDKAIVKRDRIPLSIRSKIIAALSDQYGDVLSNTLDVSPSLITDIGLRARDQMVMKLSEKSSDTSLKELIDSLASRGHLTQALLIRAVCLGDIAFLEAGLARLTGVPLQNTRKLIHDYGGNGLRAIYNKAGFDEDYFAFFNTALMVCIDLTRSGEDFDQQEFRRKVIERFLTETTEYKETLEISDIEYLLSKI